MSKLVNIYYLKDPQTLEVRYVGKTICSLYQRLSQHKNEAKNGKTHNNRWVKSLIELGQSPIIELIEQVDASIWEEKEKFWISFYRKKGCKLTNLTEGGVGVRSLPKENTAGYKRSITPEHRVKLVKGLRKWNEANKDLKSLRAKEWRASLKPLTSEKIEDIAEKLSTIKRKDFGKFTEIYINNTPNSDICKEFNYSLSVMYNTAHKLNLKRCNQIPRGKDSNGFKNKQKNLENLKTELNNILYMRNNGHTLKEIAEKYNKSIASIKRYLNEHLQMDTKFIKKIKPEDEIYVIKLRAKGLTLKQIANIYKCDKKVVAQCLQKNNILTKNQFYEKNQTKILKAKELRSQGMSWKQISEVIGVAIMASRNWCLRY